MMQKYIAIGHCKNEGEIWFLIDAETVEQAKQIVADSEGETFELSACVEVSTNSEEGISHRFTLAE